MEVIINYYGEEYPCLIRPDKTVKENKVEIANLFSMEEEYISLYIQDVLLEDDKKLLDYPLSYHCIIVLEYVNPNIVFKVKFNDTVSTFTMDYSKPVSDIIKEFMNTHQEECEGIEEKRIQLLSHGNIVDLNKSILESGITYDDEVDISFLPEEKKAISSTIVHIVACYDEKECDVDLETIDSVKSLFDYCISTFEYKTSVSLLAYSDRLIRDSMRLSDCNLAGKTLYVLPIDGFPKEWQIRDLRVHNLPKKDQASYLIDGFTHHDFSILKNLYIGWNCTGDVVNTLIPFIQEGGLNSIDVLSINDNATLVETAVFSSQVAEQGVISSIRQLILPFEKISIPSLSSLWLAIKDQISSSHLHTITISYDHENRPIKEQVLSTLQLTPIPSISYYWNDEKLEVNSIDESTLSNSAILSLLQETQSKLVSTQQELDKAYSELTALQFEKNALEEKNAQLQQTLDELASKKPAKTNPFAPTKVHSNPFANDEEGEEGTASMAMGEEEMSYEQSNDQENTNEQDVYSNEVVPAEPTEEQVEEPTEEQVAYSKEVVPTEPTEEQVEESTEVLPVEITEADKNEEENEVSSPTKLVQPKLVERMSSRKHTRSSKPKKVLRPIPKDEWSIAEDIEQSYQEVFLSRYSNKRRISNDALTNELEDKGLDDASIHNIFHLIPKQSSSKNLMEYIIAMYLADKVLEGKQLPHHSLPRSLLQRVKDSYNDDPSSASSSASSASDYSDYSSDYSDYSSDYSDYSDYSSSSSSSDDPSSESEETVPIVTNKGAFSKKRIVNVPTTRSSFDSQISAESIPQEQPKPIQKKNTWRMPTETKDRLVNEVFFEVAGNKEETTVDVIEARFLKAGISQDMIDAVIEMVAPSSTTILPIQFAVIAFLLQKQQQGIALPKHLPLPLRSLLPVKPTETSHTTWELTDKKLLELQDLWNSSCNKNNQITFKTAKSIIQTTCKNPATTRQIMKLVVSNEEPLNERQFIVAVFMAQKYCKGASISTFLPNELKDFLRGEEPAVIAKTEGKARRRSSVTSVSSRTSKNSKKEEVELSVNEEVEEDWQVDKDALKIPQTVLFKNNSKNGKDMDEQETVKFFKSIDLNDEEIDRIINLVTNGDYYPINDLQFSVAFIIAQKVKRGIAIPKRLPSSLQSLLQ